MSQLKFLGCLWTSGLRKGTSLLKSHPTNFHRSLASYAVEKKTLDFTPLRESKLPVIFVFGGPGSGKGTQCDKLVQLYGYTHLSSGNLLRQEVDTGSERGETLNAIMERGDLVPLEIVLKLLAEAMLEKLPTSKGFLIDGYPREKNQAIQFEQVILPCTKALYFELPDEVMVERLLIRAKTSGRVDDNETTIRKRLSIFHRHFEPIISHYENRCHTISALASPEEVFTEVQKALRSIL